MSRPADLRRQARVIEFHISMSESAQRRLLTQSLLDMLDHCRSDEARRILLGRTKKERHPIPLTSAERLVRNKRACDRLAEKASV